MSTEKTSSAVEAATENLTENPTENPTESPAAEEAVAAAAAEETQEAGEPLPEEEAGEIPEGAIQESRSGDEQDERELKSLVEAVIYITDEPLSAEQIADAMDRPLPLVQKVLNQLVEEYDRPDRGLTVRELAGGYKMGTKPEHHEALKAFVKGLKPALKLSLAALETLAVIAYKQPITGPEIMEIRGVQGAGVMKTLLDRKLIANAGRKAVVGKPMLYKTTKEFLLQFGLNSLNELPTLKEFEELRRMALSDDDDVLGGSPAPATPEENEAAAAEAVAATKDAVPDGTADPEPAANPVSESAPSPQPELELKPEPEQEPVEPANQNG